MVLLDGGLVQVCHQAYQGGRQASATMALEPAFENVCFAIGDLDLKGVARGKRGAMHTRYNLCASGELCDRFLRTSASLGVIARELNEGGTTPRERVPGA